jgi:peptidoglycan hydrolase-like protein with peptidoglycan-binding domain
VRRSASLVAAAVAALTVSPFVPAGVASAAPTCSRTTNVFIPDLGGSTKMPSTGSTAASTSCTMGRGAQSSAVTWLQQSLNVCYQFELTQKKLYPLATDSMFGAKTESGLRAAQSAAGTSADGVYGPHTRDAILWWGGTTTHNCGNYDGPG